MQYAAAEQAELNLGKLAYVKSNLRALVGAGGIKVLLNTLECMNDDPDLIVKTITTLDNLCSADLEYSTVVLELNGEDLIKACVHKWIVSVIMNTSSVLYNLAHAAPCLSEASR